MVFDTHLTCDEEVHKHFLSILKSYNSLTPLEKKQFLRRNGFDPSGYKGFVESSVMVMVTLGRITQDITVENHEFVINKENLDKGRNLLRDYSVPKKWVVIPQWLNDDCEMYEKF